MENNEARVNVTWSGNNGDLLDPVSFDASNAQIIEWVTEAIRSGSVQGIPADTNVNLTDFVVDRFAAVEDRPFNLISVRPKVPFGVK